ncbi:MAG: amidinotransferase [Planctomycetota bacterium]|nr:MAG: amidinotransferase [Planctomycetota bacterium]
MALIRHLKAWSRRPSELPAVPPLKGVLLADPAAFQVVECINPHMTSEDGSLNRIDAAEARKQWQALKDAYCRIGLEVAVLPPVPGLQDLCFSANPSMVLPLPDGAKEVWLGRMAHASRAAEVEHHRRFFASRKYAVREMPESVARFEGCGDGLLHPGRFLLHAGVGFRSDPGAWQIIADAHPELDVLLYELQDPRFYHLDTALAPLHETSALWVEEAFSPEGKALLQAAFPTLIPIPLEEAMNFAGNAHCPDGKHVLLQAGSPIIERKLQEAGFATIALETGEFIKSGGSVFCLKQSF